MPPFVFHVVIYGNLWDRSMGFFEKFFGIKTRGGPPSSIGYLGDTKGFQEVTVGGFLSV